MSKSLEEEIYRAELAKFEQFREKQRKMTRFIKSHDEIMKDLRKNNVR